MLATQVAAPKVRALRTCHSAGREVTALPALPRRAALSLLPLLAAGKATAEEDFQPAKVPAELKYTTIEKSYMEKDETTLDDVGRVAVRDTRGTTWFCSLTSGCSRSATQAFLGAFALVVAYLSNSPVEITRKIANARKADEERMMSDPLYLQYKAEWEAAIKRAADKAV
jgi:hypothetical protein